MKQLWVLATLIFFLQSCVPVTPTQKGPGVPKVTIDGTDQDYSARVGNVRVTTTLPSKHYQNPVKPIGSGSFLLNFDLLDQEYKDLNLKLMHFNADWTKSALTDLEYLFEYNETPINDYEFSQSINSEYVSYAVRVPNVKLPGNYLVVVYENNDPDQVLFTRRLLIYGKLVSVNAELNRSNGANYQRTHHQIDLNVHYGALNAGNPNTDFKTVLIQNHNWNTQLNLLPTSARVDQGLLEYDYFNQENNFPALNNFRFFDARSLSYRGQNVYSVRKSARGIEVILEEDLSRKGLAFGAPLDADLNGRFYTRNLDPNAKEINSEYTWVNFRLKTEKVNGDVYVTGWFNNWALEPENRLAYSEEHQAYVGSVYLKQGYYSYMYSLVSPTLPFYYFEGSHFQNYNEYEALVYYREPGKIYDVLAGYWAIN